MPLVLTQNLKNAVTGYEYADELGTSYEYPTRYRSLIQPGEKFVYYRGKLNVDGSIQVPHYFGTGVVGSVAPSGNKLRCSVERYEPFDSIVPFKDARGYLEPEANERPSREVGLHFQTGVRYISDDVYNRIVAAGLRREPTKKVAVRRVGKPGTTTKRFDPQEKIRQIALQLAKMEAKSQWPSAKVFRAPAGEHFSLIIRHSNGDTHHVAVKATDDPEPHVQLSPGDVTYAENHATVYSLWVFYAIDLNAGTGKLIKRRGRITDDDIDLQAAVRGGRLRNTSGGKTVGPIS
ncbi:hypothetical protein [Mycolicibacterium sp. OfavD-34-C]|uniref:hypothetical protein n=1 Tax=Mycolicibacterium sp. OfavD-34-C TaxID=2917746 RepID=UPI001EF59EAB|nr:hypothetical protein [Mycolicibacterium sp. OfavD-34-C]MCG7578808.1 hypothetical protein [Mycolicibacterium sp. OfavD-34-C]